jgi:hypothetical protein
MTSLQPHLFIWNKKKKKKNSFIPQNGYTDSSEKLKAVANINAKRSETLQYMYLFIS